MTNRYLIVYAACASTGNRRIPFLGLSCISRWPVSRYLSTGLLILMFAAWQNIAAQQNKAVTLMDFVKIKGGKKAEAMYFYENNWKLYRDIALKRNIIQSYQLVEVTPDSLNNFDLILVTTYKDSAQYLKSEENFAPILKEARPTGPALLNQLKPADFRQNVFFKITQAIFSSGKTKEDD